jgi:hypothetical protein
MFLLGSPFFPQFILFYFAKWQFFSWKNKLYIEKYLFLNFIEIIYQISKICCKKIHGYSSYWPPDFCWHVVTTKYGFSSCNVSHHIIMMSNYFKHHTYIYFKLEMRNHIYLTLCHEPSFITTRKTIFPIVMYILLNKTSFKCINSKCHLAMSKLGFSPNDR